ARPDITWRAGESEGGPSLRVSKPQCQRQRLRGRLKPPHNGGRRPATQPMILLRGRECKGHAASPVDGGRPHGPRGSWGRATAAGRSPDPRSLFSALNGEPL